ncbi:MAG: cytochrome P450 [Nitratireductor sp.]|nr:cytochrome P450 [Nitratireductor sp.]
MNLPLYSARPDDPAFYLDPYPAYDEMRALGPAFRWEEYGLTAFAHHASVNALLRDRRLGREATHVMSREEAGLKPIPDHLKPFYDFEAHSMLEREPPAHTRLRTLVNRAFVSRHVERLRPRIEALANELIDGFQARGQVDLLPAFAEKIPVIVIAELLGVPVDLGDQLLDWSHKMVAMYQFNRTRAIEDEAVRATGEFSEFIRSYVDRRRNDPRDDLITKLIEAEQKGDHLTTDELITTSVLLLNAGHEATVHGIGNAVKALLEAGEGGSEAFATQASAMAAADELLRFDSPLHLFTRFVLEDLEFDGVRLRRGQTVALLLGAANRDPRAFAKPDRLDFARGGAGHVAFGAGIHFCVGAPLARLEMAAALPVLFQRLPGLRLAGEAVYAERYHFHGLAGLEVAWA